MKIANFYFNRARVLAVWTGFCMLTYLIVWLISVVNQK